MDLCFALGQQFGCSVVGDASSRCHVSLRGLEDDFQLEFWGADGCVTAATQEQLGSCPWPPFPVFLTGIIWLTRGLKSRACSLCFGPYHAAEGTVVSCVGIPGRIPNKEEELLVSRLH